MAGLRYSKDIEEDALFWRVVPHYNEAQDTIPAVLRSHFGNSKQGHIEVLEIGCGTGLTTQKILSADSRIRLTAIDNVGYIIDEARKRFAGHDPLPTIEYADALDFLKQARPGQYDAVASALVMHNFRNTYRDEVLKHVYRTLKKGGVFINVDKYAQDDELAHAAALKWQLNEFKKFDDLGRSDLKDKWAQHYLDDERPDFIMREGQFVDELKVLGFSEIKKIYRYQMEASYIATK